MLRKWFLSIIGLCLLCAGMSITPVSAAAAVYTISTDKTIVNKDEAVNLTIGGNDLKDVYGYEIVLSYDSSKLSFQSANNVLPKSKTTEQNGFAISPIKSENKVTFAYTKVGKVTGVGGNQSLATFTFNGIAEGMVKVKIESVKIVQSNLVSEKQLPNKTVQLAVAKNGILFKDVLGGFWAKDSITRAALIGFVNGYPDGSFKPLNHITRAEFVTMLARALNLQDSGTDVTTFVDHDKIGAWAKPYIASGVTAGWIKGFADGTFRPDLPITRAEMTVIAVRALKLDTVQATQLTFKDAESIPSWAKQAVAVAVKSGLVNGRGNNTFVPADSANRAEAVTIILRMIDKQESLK